MYFGVNDFWKYGFIFSLFLNEVREEVTFNNSPSLKNRLCQKSYYSEKLSQSICHCEEQSDVAISNFTDQKVSF